MGTESLTPVGWRSGAGRWMEARALQSTICLNSLAARLEM